MVASGTGGLAIPRLWCEQGTIRSSIHPSHTQSALTPILDLTTPLSSSWTARRMGSHFDLVWPARVGSISVLTLIGPIRLDFFYAQFTGFLVLFPQQR